MNTHKRRRKTTTQRQIPVQEEMRRSSSETMWWIPVLPTENRQQMPQEQFERAKPSPRKIEIPVTACTGNHAIRNQTHEAEKDLLKINILSIRPPEHGTSKKTSRAKSIRRNEEQPDCDNVKQQLSAHMVNRSRSAQEINKPKTVKKKRKPSANQKLRWWMSWTHSST